MVLVDALLFLCLVGAWASTEQQTRILDDDTVQACAVALQEERAVPDELWFDYTLTDPRFAGRNTLAVDVVLDGRPRTVHCAVASRGDTIDDPLAVTSAEVVR